MSFPKILVAPSMARRLLTWSLLLATVGGVVVGTEMVAPVTVQAQEEGNNPALKTVGGLSVAFAYQTHVSIGMVGDAFQAKVYKKDQALQLLQLSINLIGAVNPQLEELAETELTDEDKDVLEKMIKINGLMKDQAEGLQAFIKRGDEDGRDKYTAAREKAKELLDSISGGEKKEE